ncbi:sigma-54-dependent Fis family transcriptional regulator [Geomonas sp. RF6]|uniref:sigma-54-dependent Fis family transcriptional regulator n=1 Tax=Geomonas sp. RF6 TaxID=2897342 RepID=UPI001E509075|nr:sigma-54-dependent Fis family transcriptional regulator [Geomonas sp. RF6]UFS70680.1 sigma-54-dependent Fis family transcriptional regulator [Geomonas sp. RF6]
MKSLFEKVAPAGYVILLGDQNGVTIDFLGDPKDEKENREAGLYLGSVWSESIEGTCGMGTCIEERRAITIHRDEHFRSRHIGLSCSTTPLFMPDGALLGTLDVSLLRPPDDKNSQRLALQLVNYYARMIENAYFLRMYKDNWIIRFNHMQAFVEVITENIVAVDGEGFVVAANDRALRELTGPHGASPINRHVGEVFDLKFDQLMNHALHKTTTILPVRALSAGLQYYATFRAPEMSTSARGEKTLVIGKSAPKKGNTSLTLDYLAGTDPQMMRNAGLAKRVVNKDISLLLIGETGTGKEVFARAVHEASDRAGRPFVALNCASIPESLIESELFGYKQGAFTGANSKGMRGKILQSDGGTLFLDEIGDMPLNLQTRLLRVLAEKEILALGSETPQRVDLHVICATLRNLEEMVRAGQFREDLYYRLNGFTITLPPLRERQDRALVIENVLAAEAGSDSMRIDPEAFGCLLDYTWPGNIRQLRNVMRYSIAVSEGGTIGVADLPPEVVRTAAPPVAKPVIISPPELVVLTESDTKHPEYQAVHSALRRHKWNITDASKELQMSRSTLYRKMRKHSIIPPNEFL